MALGIALARAEADGAEDSFEGRHRVPGSAWRSKQGDNRMKQSAAYATANGWLGAGCGSWSGSENEGVSTGDRQRVPESYARGERITPARADVDIFMYANCVLVV